MNTRYSSAALGDYFKDHRCRWEEFYPSEREVIEGIAAKPGGLGRVLDVGCARGGLGQALCRAFPLESYTGVDIHGGMIETARQSPGFSCPADFVHGDILDLDFPGGFDTVISLSCADWNIETGPIIDSCWRHVRPGGSLALSLRLTPGPGLNDVARSFQPIGPEGPAREVANYVVFNVFDALRLLSSLSPAPGRLLVRGYWGKPSPTAVTPYGKLVFAVARMDKPAENDPSRSVESDLRLPLDLLLGGAQ